MIAETIANLLTAFRLEVDDAIADTDDDTDKLWSNAELLLYATEAADATARATLALREVIDIAVVASTAEYARPARILEINDAFLISAKRRLEPTNLNTTPQYELFDTPGPATRYGQDVTYGVIRLLPTPNESDTLRLHCTTTISEALTLSDDVPFTAVPDQRIMLEYMKGLAYRKPDVETLDLQRAKAHMDEFDRLSKARRSAFNNNHRRPGVVRMNW